MDAPFEKKGPEVSSHTCELSDLMPSVSEQTLRAEAVLSLSAVCTWDVTCFVKTLEKLAADELYEVLPFCNLL